MKRRVEPEWLDELPPDDPRARRSRNDLRRINTLMGNAGILARTLLESHETTAPRRIVELGAGDGTLLLRVAQKISRTWPRVAFGLVDQAAIVSEATRQGFSSLGCECECIEADVFDWLQGDGARPGDWFVANLFLHHFAEEKLRALLSLIAAKAELFAACETRRAWIPWALGHLLGMIGCNAVTRHDAVLSVRAGFCGREISQLWTRSPRFQIAEGKAGWASHRFLARQGISNPPHHG